MITLTRPVTIARLENDRWHVMDDPDHGWSGGVLASFATVDELRAHVDCIVTPGLGIDVCGPYIELLRREEDIPW